MRAACLVVTHSVEDTVSLTETLDGDQMHKDITSPNDAWTEVNLRNVRPNSTLRFYTAAPCAYNLPTIIRCISVTE